MNNRFIVHILPIMMILAGIMGCSNNKKSQSGSATEITTVTMYKNPGCQCCTAWAQHLEANGFEVTEEPTPKLEALKMQHDVPNDMGSCHTAIIGDYVVEGHVPVEDIKNLLAEKPDARGIAVPGMPIGSPGMEMPGRDPEPYKVYLFQPDGSREIYSQH